LASSWPAPKTPCKSSRQRGLGGEIRLGMGKYCNLGTDHTVKYMNMNNKSVYEKKYGYLKERSFDIIIQMELNQMHHSVRNGCFDGIFPYIIFEISL
jgi:hypothetical protein